MAPFITCIKLCPCHREVVCEMWTDENGDCNLRAEYDNLLRAFKAPWGKSKETLWAPGSPSLGVGQTLWRSSTLSKPHPHPVEWLTKNSWRQSQREIKIYACAYALSLSLSLLHRSPRRTGSETANTTSPHWHTLISHPSHTFVLCHAIPLNTILLQPWLTCARTNPHLPFV